MSHETLMVEAKGTLSQLASVLESINQQDYGQQIEWLGNSTIGAHTRHIIELYRQLLEGYATASINYDNRKRDPLIQACRDAALDALQFIYDQIEKPDISLKIYSIYHQNPAGIDTTYYRELLYNIEHTIHHLATIHIALRMLGKPVADPSLGMAKSSLEYQKQCAQ